MRELNGGSVFKESARWCFVFFFLLEVVVSSVRGEITRGLQRRGFHVSLVHVGFTPFLEQKVCVFVCVCVCVPVDVLCTCLL